MGNQQWVADSSTIAGQLTQTASNMHGEADRMAVER
jgi:hypothetical protein